MISKHGKPLVKVVALNVPASNEVKRAGFLTGQIAVPDDFDQMGGAAIEQLFGGKK